MVGILASPKGQKGATMTLIKREDAIEEIGSAMATSGSIILIAGLACAKGIIASLPSAEADWIPCSERLPNEDGRYLVTYPLFVRKDKWVNVLWYGKPSMPNIKVKGKCWYRSDDEYGDVVYDDVIAWQELPKPYREDGE